MYSRARQQLWRRAADLTPAQGEFVLPSISIIVPVLDEAAAIERLLTELAPWRAAGDEVIVVDGGSRDETVARATAFADSVLAAPRGRARQQNAGAAVARGALLWFVHADSIVGDVSRTEVLAAAATAPWGRCTIRIDDRAVIFRVIETLMNLRTRLTSMVTGDHGIFVTHDVFDAVGGIPDLALMEDLEFSRRLARHARVHCLRSTIATSARRWRRHGVFRTIVLMWALRLAWFAGAPAPWLARLYGYKPS